MHCGNVRQSIALRRRAAVDCIPATYGSLAFRQRAAIYCIPATYASLLNCGMPVLRQRLRQRQCCDSLLHCGNVWQSIALRQRTTVCCTAATHDSLLHCDNARQSSALRNAHFCNSDILHTCRLIATADQIILMRYTHSNITDISKAVCPQ